MPNWKKVITSGSDAQLNSLKITGAVNANTDTDKFLVLDTAGNVDYRTGNQVLSDIGAAGSANLSGTPVDNQIAIFTNSNTIEGDSNLTWNGSTLNVNGAVHASNYAVDLQMGSTSYLTIGGTYSGVHFHGGATTNGILAVAGTAGQSYGGAGLEINNAANANDNSFIRLAASSSGASGASAFWSFGINASDNSHDFVFTNYSTLTGASPALTISKSTNQVKIGSLVVSGSGTFKNIGPAEFSGSVSITTADQVAATTDTDKFMVLDGQQIKYRTGTEVYDDIGVTALSSSIAADIAGISGGVITPIQLTVDTKNLSNGHVPWSALSDLQANANRAYTTWIAPTSGYLDKVIVSPEQTNTTTDNVRVQFVENGTTTETISVAMGAAGVNKTFTFTPATTAFSTGDRLSLVFDKITNTSDLYNLMVVFRLSN